MEANYKPKDETQQTRRNKLIFLVVAYMLSDVSQLVNWLVSRSYSPKQVAKAILLT